VVAAACIATAATARAQTAPDLLTAPERSGYLETTRYDDVVTMLRALAARSPLLCLTAFGYSLEGRPLPLAVVGRVAGADPDAVRRSGRLVVYVQANIHAGEVEGKEATLMLLRALVAGERGYWLDSLVLLVAPIYNADGNERVTLTNRPLQDGPYGGIGQRANALGLDLNRDHAKLETSEARAQASLLTRYAPHVALDLHTTNGTVHAYHLTYAEPLHPATDASIVRVLRGEWLPAVTARLRERTGWETWFYGNTPSAPVDRGRGGPEPGWYTFDHRPRFSQNYWGLRNIFGVLSEAYAYASFAERIAATRLFVEETLDWAWANASRLREAVRAAETRRLVGARLPLRARLRRGPETTVLLGGVDTVAHPFTGQPVLTRNATRRPTRLADFTTFEGVEEERVPAAYLVPASLTAVIERLAAHGVRLRRLERPVTLPLERFRIDSTTVAAREFQGHRERTVWGGWEPSHETLPARTVIVDVAQPLGRLVVLLLEPRSDDGFVNWNLLDEALAQGAYLPIRRSHADVR
jgi:hypothetical protein